MARPKTARKFVRKNVTKMKKPTRVAPESKRIIKPEPPASVIANSSRLGGKLPKGSKSFKSSDLARGYA